MPLKSSSRFDSDKHPIQAWYDLCHCCDKTEPSQFPLAHTIRERVNLSAKEVATSARSMILSRDHDEELKASLYCYMRQSLNDPSEINELMAAERLGLVLTATEGLEQYGVCVQIGS